MMKDLNSRQIEKLSDLFMDLAKGLFLAGFTIQVFKSTDLVSLAQYLACGIMCVYLSLRLTGRQK